MPNPTHPSPDLVRLEEESGGDQGGVESRQLRGQIAASLAKGPYQWAGVAPGACG